MPKFAQYFILAHRTNTHGDTRNRHHTYKYMRVASEHLSDYPSSTSPPHAVPNQPTSPTAFARAHSRHYSLAHIKRTNSDDTLPGLTHARSLLLEHISISLLLAAEASFEATCAQRGTPAHHIYAHAMAVLVHCAKACASHLSFSLSWCRARRI